MANKFDKHRPQVSVKLSQAQQAISMIPDDVKRELMHLVSPMRPHATKSTEAERVAYLTALDIKETIGNYLDDH